MKERQSRLKAIKNLIKNNTIESQDDLLALLLKEGYDVTQATLSRDLKLLKVGKVPDGQNGYKYALLARTKTEKAKQFMFRTFCADMLVLTTAETLL